MADSGITRMDRMTMKPYRIKLLDEGTIPARCDDVSLWSTSGTGVTETLERGLAMNGTGAIKATTTSGNISIRHTPVSALDLNGKTITVRYYVSAGAAFSTITLFCFTSTGNYYQYSFGTPYTGWMERTLTNADFTGTGTPDWASIAYYYVTWYVSGTNLPAYVLLDLVSVDYPGPCIVLPTTDDADDTIIDDYLPLCQANGIEMTHFIDVDSIGGIGKLTAAELDTLYAAGWDIGAHGMTHATLTGLSVAAATAEMVDSKAYLLGRGYTRSAHHFSWPGSAYNNALLQIARGIFRSARMGFAAAFSQAPHTPAYSDWNWILRGYACDGITTAAFAAYLDKAIATGSVCIPYWHTLAAADFQTEIEYLAAKVTAGDCVTMTFSEYWTWIKQRYGSSSRWRTKQA